MRYDFDIQWTVRRRFLCVPRPSDRIQVSFILNEQLHGFLPYEFPEIDPGEKLIAIMNATRDEFFSNTDMISQNLSKIGLVEEIHDPIIDQIKAMVNCEANLTEIVVEVRFVLFRLDEHEEVRFKAISSNPALIEAMERVKVRKEDDLSCVICLDKFSPDLEVSRMPCSHTFHENCISHWLQIRFSCPLCRFEMPQH